MRVLILKLGIKASLHTFLGVEETFTQGLYLVSSFFLLVVAVVVVVDKNCSF